MRAAIAAVEGSEAAVSSLVSNVMHMGLTSNPESGFVGIGLQRGETLEQFLRRIGVTTLAIPREVLSMVPRELTDVPG